MNDFQKTPDITQDTKTTMQDILIGIILTTILIAGLTAIGAIPSCYELEVQINQMQGGK